MEVIQLENLALDLRIFLYWLDGHHRIVGYCSAGFFQYFNKLIILALGPDQQYLPGRERVRLDLLPSVFSLVASIDLGQNITGTGSQKLSASSTPSCSADSAGPRISSSRITEPSTLPTRARTHRLWSSCNSEKQAMGTWQPLQMPVMCSLGGYGYGLGVIEAGQKFQCVRSPVRHSIPTAPCPPAGRQTLPAIVMDS